MDKIINFVDGLLKKSTPDAPAWNIEHKLEAKEPKWNYVDGCMIKAILDLYYATNNQEYFDFAKNFVDYYVNENGEILGYEVEEYNCDNINMGKVLFDLDNITPDEKYKKAIEFLCSQLKTHPRIKAGNFWHKKIYPNQVWLDGLYMVQPFNMRCVKNFGDESIADDVLSQFKNVNDIMRDETTGLLYHGYDESKSMFWANKETGLSKNFWTRSIGWYAMAIVDTLEKVDEEFIANFAALKDYLKALLDAVLKFADPATKMFYQVTNEQDRDGNYLETSGTCAFAYALMKSARLNYLPSDYFEKGKEIFDSVVKQKLVLTDDEFSLKDICLVAGLGGMPGKGDYKLRDGTYEYYISEPRVDNDAKGVAPFLFAFSEILRIKGGNT